jgi:hypothetical protein
MKRCGGGSKAKVLSNVPMHDSAKKYTYHCSGLLSPAFWDRKRGISRWRSDYARVVVEDNFSVETARYFDTHSVPGPMYNNYEFGGYPLWAQGPEHKLLID